MMALCPLDVGKVSTVHQAPFQEPTNDPVCSDHLDDRRSCLGKVLTVFISVAKQSVSPLSTPGPGKGQLVPSLFPSKSCIMN